MKKLSQAVVCASALAVTGFSSLAVAESPLTANIGVSSNYLWRGVSQTAEASAVSGGVDYAHDSGFYIGTWVSNVTWTTNDGYEHDVYLGYGGKAGPVSYDIGYISYIYPVGDAEEDFSELLLSVGYGPVTFLYAPTVGKEDSSAPEDDVYMSISAEFEVKKDLTLGVLYGSYDFDGGDASDYTHYQISLSKDDFTIAYDVVDPETDDPTKVVDAPRISVSWSKSFDL